VRRAGCRGRCSGWWRRTWRRWSMEMPRLAAMRAGGAWSRSRARWMGAGSVRAGGQVSAVLVAAGDVVGVEREGELGEDPQCGGAS
jgi:hypothetical protein